MARWCGVLQARWWVWALGWDTRQGMGWGSRHMVGFQTGVGFQSCGGIPDTDEVPDRDGGYQIGMVGYQTGMVGYQTGGGIPDACGGIPDSVDGIPNTAGVPDMG